MFQNTSFLSLPLATLHLFDSKADKSYMQGSNITNKESMPLYSFLAVMCQRKFDVFVERIERRKDLGKAAIERGGEKRGRL